MPTTGNGAGPDSADLYLYQGSDWASTVVVTNADGTDADLTGCSAKAQIRRDVADAADLEAEMVATVQAPNLIQLSLAREATEELCGRYVWDLDLTDAAGTVTTLLAGRAVVTQEVTRDVPAMAMAGAAR